MIIETGLFEHMVLQRAGKVAQRAMVTGNCMGKGTVFARAITGGAEVRGWRRRKVGTADGKRFEATMAGLPVGGPYEIELRCGEASVTVKDVLVGDVWILAGQSNMQGCGHFPAKPLGKEPMVRAFYMDDHWAVAVDPIHQLAIAVDPVHNGGVRVPVPKKGVWRGVGPGVSYGQAMRRRTGVPQGLIACAHGGTTTAQWDPRLKKLGGGSLYGATMRRLAKNYPGGTVAGLLWYQGCSDTDAGTYQGYREATKRIFQGFRRDIGRKDLPIVLVQIARTTGMSDEAMGRRWSAVREDERILGETLAYTATVPAVDLELDEAIHLSGPGQYLLGERMAEAMESIRLAGTRGAPRPPIRPESIAIREHLDGNAEIVVTFANVVGNLTTLERPMGFHVEVPRLHSDYPITRTRLEGNRAYLLTAARPKIFTLFQGVVFYGFGCDPYCNVHDEAGRPVPAFGPLPLSTAPRTTSDFAAPADLRFSVFHPAARDLSDCARCPETAGIDRPAPASVSILPSGYCNLYPMIAERGKVDEIFYLLARFHCDGDWKVHVHFGYDSPARMWVDGKPVFHDPVGRPPATPDKGGAIVDAAKGEHEIVLGIGTNGGNAYGMTLWLERIDRPPWRGGPGYPRFF